VKGARRLISAWCRLALPERLMAMPVGMVFFQQAPQNAEQASRLRAMAMGAGEAFAQRQHREQHAHERSRGKHHSLASMRPGWREPADPASIERPIPRADGQQGPATADGGQGLARCESQDQHRAEAPIRFSRAHLERVRRAQGGWPEVVSIPQASRPPPINSVPCRVGTSKDAVGGSTAPAEDQKRAAISPLPLRCSRQSTPAITICETLLLGSAAAS